MTVKFKVTFTAPKTKAKTLEADYFRVEEQRLVFRNEPMTGQRYPKTVAVIAAGEWRAVEDAS